MKALSIKNPFGHLIILGLKTREHRTWNTKYRGRFLIHASEQEDKDFIREYGFKENSLPKSALIGFATLINTEQVATKKWAFILKDIHRFPKPVPHKGALNFFEVDVDEETVKRAGVRVT